MYKLPVRNWARRSPVFTLRSLKSPARFSHVSAMSVPKTHHVSLFEKVGDSTDLIQYKEVAAPQISDPKDIIVKNSYAGVNFIESYFRKGIYPATLPYTFGREATGVVAAVGDQVTNVKVGDKVVYLGGNLFAEYTKLEPSNFRVTKLDPSTTDEQLKVYSASIVGGLTAYTLVTDAYHVKKGDQILVWAAAGGVGQVLTQLASHAGADVIAIASTAEKLQIAKDRGAKYLINSSSDDIVAKVLEYTNGVGAVASFDSVGKDSFEASLASLKLRGHFVSYGNASGVVPPFPLGRLSAKNISVVRPVLTNYVATPEEWESKTREFFALIDAGKVDIGITKTYPLSEYRQAATDLESRKTTGRLVLEIGPGYK